MAKNSPNFSDRTITDFRSRLSGGGARSNLFECEINFPAFIRDILGDNVNELDQDLRFMVKASQIPGSTIGTIPIPFRGRTLKVSGDRTFDPWTITVINDTNYRIRDAFEKWSNALNRHDDSAGIITPSLYQSDMIVRHLGRGNVNSNTPTRDSQIPVLRSYKFYGCWPSDLSPMDLSYDSTDTIQEYTVTIQYQWNDPLLPNDDSALGTPN